MVRLFFVMIAGLAVGVVTFIAGLSVGAFVMYELMTPFGEPDQVNFQTLKFPSAKAEIFLSARKYGFLTSHEEVRICDKPIKFNEGDNCLVFYTSELFYDRAGGNRLVVYVSPDAVPIGQANRIGAIDVKVRDLDDVVRRDYEQLGLMRIYAP